MLKNIYTACPCSEKALQKVAGSSFSDLWSNFQAVVSLASIIPSAHKRPFKLTVRDCILRAKERYAFPRARQPLDHSLHKSESNQLMVQRSPGSKESVPFFRANDTTTILRTCNNHAPLLQLQRKEELVEGEGMAKGEKQEGDLVKLILSWSLEDVFNQDLFKHKVSFTYFVLLFYDSRIILLL